MYEELKHQLEELEKSSDTEEAHRQADDILCQIALDTQMLFEQRKELVDLYEKVGKWYA